MEKNNMIFQKHEPKYKQLYQYFRREIEEGSYLAHESLPSKRGLSSLLGVSLRTVELAYEQLVAEGYVYSQQRKGYFASPLLNLNKEIRTIATFDSEVIKKPECLYSFSLSGVEGEGFPWNVLKSLGKLSWEEHQLDLLGGGNAKGQRKLRENIAHYLREARGFSPDPRRILISSGTESLLQLLFLLLDQDSLALEDPGFRRLHTLCEDLGKKVFPIGLDQDGMVPEELRKSGCNLAFITPSHQFPTGLVYPVGRRLELLSWAMEEEKRFLIEDDYDSEFRYGINPVPSLKSLDRGDKVIYLGSFSKSISPSLKLSYLILPDCLMEIFENLSYLSCPVSLSIQYVISDFIEKGHYTRHLNRMRKIYKQKREILVQAILELDPGARVGGSDAGLFITLIPEIDEKEEILIDKAKNKGIHLYGISEFSLRNEKGRPQLLLGFAALKKEEIRSAVETLYMAWKG